MNTRANAHLDIPRRLVEDPDGKQAIPIRIAPEDLADRSNEDRMLARQLLAKARRTPPVRRDLVNRIRAEIARGEYETSERLSVAAEGLMFDLVETVGRAAS